MTKEVAKRDETLPAVAHFEQDADGGFEETTADSFCLSYLTILQKGSPQCDPDDGRYIEGVKVGQLYNTGTNAVYDGEEGVRLIPVYYMAQYVEWVPRSQGGGFRGWHKASSDVVQKAVPGEGGRLVLDNGNELEDTRYHVCLLGPAYRPVVVALKSSQIKKSRVWMTEMDEFLMDGSDGQFRPPTFAHVYRATTQAESNDKGSWRGWRFQRLRTLDLEDEVDRTIYVTARELKAQILSGEVKIGTPADDAPAQETRF